MKSGDFYDFGSILKQHCMYNGPCKITEEKKKDLIGLLPLIDSMFHSIYEGLLTDERLKNIDPDL
ncbi:hypothetical protein PR048_002459 [Dryococelus australis]|uniref:Uncharacterized protein n=1 Tax=Dryococelus australis TaxID=614101 RepID=A0ABQ9IMP2_9NEOP|nr:hypothetical protein PR048_002459 [Dryococelus australis]